MLSWILALIAIGFLFVLYPFVFNKDSSIAKSQEQAKIAEKDNVRLFKEQQEQFQRQLDVGDIDAQQFKRLLAEAEQLLLANTTLESQQKPKDLAGGLWLLPILLVAFPLATIAVYQQIGAIDDQEIAALIETQSSKSINLASPQWDVELIDALKERVISRPSNIYYWAMLAQWAISNDDIASANQYFAAALKVEPADSFLLAQYAESLFLLEGNRFTPRVTTAVDAAFAADATSQTVLGLKGIEAFSNNDPSLAITYWRRAQQQLDPAGAIFQGLQAGIDGAQRLLALWSDGSLTTNTIGQSHSVSAYVSIDPRVPASPDQRVFVAVLRVDGSPMPLAAKKIGVFQLPATILLTDMDALVAGQELSTASRVKVVARLSLSGSATPQVGDWEAVSDTIMLNEKGVSVSLSIDRQRK
ncbi:c-type cytochrome biogenesis protein CcmI [Porticoccaceae bacterium]|nr:c-type cytochrome biogenesis protein CcmI [Porticoccaceae bacterium]